MYLTLYIARSLTEGSEAVLSFMCMPKSLQDYSSLCYGCCVTGQNQLWAFGRMLKIDTRWRDWNTHYRVFPGNTLAWVKGITQSTSFSLLHWLICFMLDSPSPSPVHLSCASSLVPNFWKNLACRILIVGSKHREVICSALSLKKLRHLSRC